MWHMPYERMVVGDDPEDTPERLSAQSTSQEDAESSENEDAGRTPLSAEGPDGEERRTPQAEPGPTPGSAEGEDFDEPSRH